MKSARVRNDTRAAPRAAPEPALRPDPSRTPAIASSAPSGFAARLWLFAIILLGAFLRLYRPGQSPPGLNQDEALSAWISWCLLKTGHDMTGQAWPIFYSHGIGDYPSTLYFYTLMPFQALGGLNIWTTRLPAAAAGILSLPVIYWIGSRMFGRPTGLLAAAMLAVNPWHLFLSRFGVGASQCPLYAMIPLALMLKARLPLTDAPEETPRPVWALLAGLAAGVSCYGFHPMKLYFPFFFPLLVAVAGPAWWRLRRSREGVGAVLLLALGFAVTFGPLAWQHVVDPVIGRRWEMTRLWEPGTPLPRILVLVLGRYLAHFSPDFLFMRGDLFAIIKPIGQGEFAWYLLPCMAAGLGLLLARAWSSRSARVLLALLLVYPAGDVISEYFSVHALRSAPGMHALVLLAAFGAASGWLWLRSRRRALALAAAAALALAAIVLDARYLTRYFGEYNRRPEIYKGYYVDLVEAADWLRPRLEQADAVFVTTHRMNEPWAILLVALGHDPRQWFREPRDMRTLDGWDVCLRYGKMHFMYRNLWEPDFFRLARDGIPQRAIFIVRPGEQDLTNPAYVVRRPDGSEALLIYEVTL